MKIDYAWVSTLDQNPDLQKDVLEKVKELLRKGDPLVV